MPPVYVTVPSNGAFAAFWEKDADTVSFFLPSGLTSRFVDVSRDDWRSVKELERPAVDDFPDVVDFGRNWLATNSLQVAESTIVISKRKPGIYHPRVWRGMYQVGQYKQYYNPVSASKHYGTAFIQSLVAAESLFSALTELFRFVEPAQENLQTFSHRIRELLILICTELEAAWRGVLVSNGYAATTRLTTTDYVRAGMMMGLREAWGVGLKNHPDAGSYFPFKHWDKKSPTKSLSWYSSYNGVKHDREGEFPRANLRNLLDAAAALFIMQAAQWGPEVYDKMGYGRESPFYLSCYPTFNPEEIYIAALDGSDTMTAEKYFSAADVGS